MSEPVIVANTARDTLDYWLDAGWPTEGYPDWLTGGYVTKERAAAALRLLADRLDALEVQIQHARKAKG